MNRFKIPNSMRTTLLLITLCLATARLLTASELVFQTIKSFGFEDGAGLHMRAGLEQLKGVK
jgi:hypothetical protein